MTRHKSFGLPSVSRQRAMHVSRDTESCPGKSPLLCGKKRTLQTNKYALSVTDEDSETHDK